VSWEIKIATGEEKLPFYLMTAGELEGAAGSDRSRQFLAARTPNVSEPGNATWALP